MNVSPYRILADLVVFIHAAYVSFVVFGLLLILMGGMVGWRWVRNVWFRGAHLVFIGVVVVESLVNITCPLTTLEDWLRGRAGETVQGGSFLGRWAHELIFFDAPPWVFTSCYCAFGLLVVGALFLVPPNWPPRLRRAENPLARK